MWTGTSTRPSLRWGPGTNKIEDRHLAVGAAMREPRGLGDGMRADDAVVVTSGVEPERQLIRSLTRKEGKAEGRSPGWAARRHRCLRHIRRRGGRRYPDCGDHEGSCQGE